MSVFILETEAVSSAADGLSSVESSLSNLSDTINGYDTSQSGGDNFDFDGAKAVIAANVKAASVKVKNTQTLMTSVVESHTQLQESLKYGETGKAAEEKAAQQRQSSGPTSGTSGGYSGSYSSGGHHSSGGHYVSPTPIKKKDKEKDKDKEEETKYTGIIPVAKDKYKTDDSKKKEITKALSGVGLVAMTKSITAKEKESFEKLYDVKYTKEGLAKVGDRYVISCDKSYGEVGDMIDLKQKDGSYVKCIVGGQTSTDIAENKNNIRFMTKEDITDKKVIATTQDIKKNTTNVYNAGADKEHQKVNVTTDNPNNNTTTTDNPGNNTTTTDNPNSSTGTSTENTSTNNTTTTTDNPGNSTTTTDNPGNSTTTTDNPNSSTGTSTENTNTNTEGITYTDQTATSSEQVTAETVDNSTDDPTTGGE